MAKKPADWEQFIEIEFLPVEEEFPTAAEVALHPPRLPDFEEEADEGALAVPSGRQPSTPSDDTDSSC